MSFFGKFKTGSVRSSSHRRQLSLRDVELAVFAIMTMRAHEHEFSDGTAADNASCRHRPQLRKTSPPRKTPMRRSLLLLRNILSMSLDLRDLMAVTSSLVLKMYALLFFNVYAHMLTNTANSTVRHGRQRSINPPSTSTDTPQLL